MQVSRAQTYSFNCFLPNFTNYAKRFELRQRHLHGNTWSSLRDIDLCGTTFSLVKTISNGVFEEHK